MTEQIKTITIDNVEYEVEKLSPKTQALVRIYQKWVEEQQKQRLDLAKTEAALRDLSRELTEVVKNETEKKDEK
jgi:hypothetical protein